MKKIITNLILIYDNEKILLGMKKRGFGEGKWNGFGGKIHEGETIKEAARRELKEEAAIDLNKIDNLKERGIINFHFDGKDEIQEVHFLSVSSGDIVGKPKETEEMFSRWFNHSEIPFEKMWVDDPHWMPHLLKGKNFSGDFYFNNDGSAILKKNLEVT